jgi:hypothetical protein
VKWEAAKELWLSTIEKSNGPDSDATAFVCDRRAELLQEKDCFEQAIILIERTSKILSRKHNTASPEMVRAGCNAIACRGMNYQSKKQLELAERAYKIAIGLGNTLGPKECKPADAALWLACMYAREDRIAEAKVLLQRASDDTISTLRPEKKFLAFYIREAVKECILFEDYEVPQQFLPPAVMFSQEPYANVNIEQELINAFARLDNGKLACELQERVIAFDKTRENNSRGVDFDLEHLARLEELKKKHVKALGTHTPEDRIIIEGFHSGSSK